MGRLGGVDLGNAPGCLWEASLKLCQVTCDILGPTVLRNPYLRHQAVSRIPCSARLGLHCFEPEIPQPLVTPLKFTPLPPTPAGRLPHC